MLLVITKIQSNYYRTNFYFKTMKNTEGVPYGRGLEVPESSVLSVVLILLAIANIVTNNYKKETLSRDSNMDLGREISYI